jgi:hypothetical protein
MSQLNLPPYLLMIRMYYSQPMLDPALRPVSYLKRDFLHPFKPKLELHIFDYVLDGALGAMLLVVLWKSDEKA